MAIGRWDYKVILRSNYKSNKYQDVAIWTSLLCGSSTVGRLHTYATGAVAAHTALECLLELL